MKKGKLAMRRAKRPPILDQDDCDIIAKDERKAKNKAIAEKILDYLLARPPGYWATTTEITDRIGVSAMQIFAAESALPRVFRICRGRTEKGISLHPDVDDRIRSKARVYRRMSERLVSMRIRGSFLPVEA